MALSEDQKAMLRLLAQRGEAGYEDLAALLGIGVDEVHAKATTAAAELEAEGIPAPPIPSPPGAGATEEARPQPRVARPQPPVAGKPAAPEKAAAPPAVPQAPRSRPKLPAPQLPGFSMPRDRRARAAIAAAVLALTALIVVFAVSGDDPDERRPASGDSTSTSEAAGAADSQLTQAVLEPVDGGEGKGVAVFGRIKKNVVLQVQAEGLEPSPQGSSYTVWLYKSPQLALRVGSVRVADSGGIASQFPVPRELLTYIATGTFDQIDLSLTADAAYRREIAAAKKAERLPAYTGESILRGPITGPAIEAARAAGNGK